MGAPKGNSNSPTIRDLKYKNVSKDKPLTEKEEAFVFHYIGDCNQNATQSALAAGYSKKAAKSTGYDLTRKPNVAHQIQLRLNDYFSRLDITAFDVLERLVQIGMSNISDVARIEDNQLHILDSSQMTKRGLASISEVTQSTDIRGGQELKIKQRDVMPALIKLFELFRLGDKDLRAPRARSDEQRDVLNAVLNGDMSPTDAMLTLDLKGVPIPDSIFKLVAKEAPVEDEVEDDTNFPTPQEVDALHRKKLHDIEVQRETFLPKRRQEVQEIKEELSGKEAFDGKEES